MELIILGARDIQGAARVLCNFGCILKAWHVGAHMAHGCKHGSAILGESSS